MRRTVLADRLAEPVLPVATAASFPPSVIFGK
jgi:hypothetical protein